MDIKDVAKKAGGVVALSKKLGLSRGAVCQWTKVPVDRVLETAAATGWQVTPHDLRSDIYPHPDDGLPDDMRSHIHDQEAA